MAILAVIFAVLGILLAGAAVCLWALAREGQAEDEEYR